MLRLFCFWFRTYILNPAAMATYAIGDIQGCYSSLRRLLDKCRFDPARDRLWLVGDLVNRGSQSLAVLRFVKSLGARAVTILGNHDLHLLGVAAGGVKPHRGDTLAAILHAPDRDELLDWLRHRKMMHADAGYAMVHAGLLPQWSIAKALKLAHEVEAVLQSDGYDEFLLHMYGNQPDRWRDNLTGIARLRVITNVMTRLRICTVGGRMEFAHKGKPLNLPRGFMPWYGVPYRRSRGVPVIFGHWAALGLYTGSNVIALDTGCVWGGALSAFRLSDRQLYQHACAARARPARRQ
jgi:bis(5'-nucleosyl)-tetraphosphatase (symmetrical)